VPSLVQDTADRLGTVTRALPKGEARPGQLRMAEAVAAAIEGRRHLVVQAGTGTGKTLAYLVPAVLSGRKVVVATATLALQDQLVRHDLPALHRSLDRPFRWAVLKGRSNYFCLQRAAELAGAGAGGEQLVLGGDRARAEVARLAAWAPTSRTGDRAELAVEPSPAAWSAVSVSARDCPGAHRCPVGQLCFAEKARQAAAEADVVVVNTHLYAAHLASGGVVLPEHDVVVLDEAHVVEDVVAAAAGVELTPGRFRALRATLGTILAPGGEDGEGAEALGDALLRSAEQLTAAVAPLLEGGRRLRPPLRRELADALEVGRGRVERATASLLRLGDGLPAEAAGRRVRALSVAASLAEDLGAVLRLDRSSAADSVLWVEGTAEAPVLRLAPVDCAELLQRQLWEEVTAVLTSATIPIGLATRLGAPADRCDELDVGSPFDYERQALLYCAAHLPEPREPSFEEAAHRELERLITASGGRALALFTSWRAMQAAVEALRGRLPWTVLAQGELPRPALLAAFAAEESSCLFATTSFWQGIDVPGPSLSLVVIDKLPFPRPDEPLLQARRERAGAAGFTAVDLPRAATLLAQATGRLVRAADDRGVVAVLDRRLATNRRYRWELVRALPPMRRTKDPDEATAVLEALRTGDDRCTGPRQ
jgi:ATP-dependent DNA helicase DinG